MFRTLEATTRAYPSMDGVSAVNGMLETKASASLTTSGVPAPRRRANWVADFSKLILREDSLTLWVYSSLDLSHEVLVWCNHFKMR